MNDDDIQKEKYRLAMIQKMDIDVDDEEVSQIKSIPDPKKQVVPPYTPTSIPTNFAQPMFFLTPRKPLTFFPPVIV